MMWDSISSKVLQEVWAELEPDKFDTVPPYDFIILTWYSLLFDTKPHPTQNNIV